MIVDSTALPEQAVRDVARRSPSSPPASAVRPCAAFIRAGRRGPAHHRRCSRARWKSWSLAIRWHYGHRRIGPVIDAEARRRHPRPCRTGPHGARAALLKAELPLPGDGAWHLHRARGACRCRASAMLTREIFGPVLHIATFKSGDRSGRKVVAAINATGYGLTFGLHTRIDNRVQPRSASADGWATSMSTATRSARWWAANPSAAKGFPAPGQRRAGRSTSTRFCRTATPAVALDDTAPAVDEACGGPKRSTSGAGGSGHCHAQATRIDLPGPTGESNRLSAACPRATSSASAPVGLRPLQQAERHPGKLGGRAVEAPGHLPPEAAGHASTAFPGPSGGAMPKLARAHAHAACGTRSGPILPLITGGMPDRAHAMLEARHLCIDTTASGGNAAASGRGWYPLDI